MNDWYTLEATYKGKVSRFGFLPDAEGRWPGTRDGAAMVDGVFHIFRLADKGRGARRLPWAYGSIRLLAPDGRVVDTMEPKEEP